MPFILTPGDTREKHHAHTLSTFHTHTLAHTTRGHTRLHRTYGTRAMSRDIVVCRIPRMWTSHSGFRYPPRYIAYHHRPVQGSTVCMRTAVCTAYSYVPHAPSRVPANRGRAACAWLCRASPAQAPARRKLSKVHGLLLTADVAIPP